MRLGMSARPHDVASIRLVPRRVATTIVVLWLCGVVWRGDGHGDVSIATTDCSVVVASGAVAAQASVAVCCGRRATRAAPSGNRGCTASASAAPMACVDDLGAAQCGADGAGNSCVVVAGGRRIANADDADDDDDDDTDSGYCS